jgi:hypothetical protein
MEMKLGFAGKLDAQAGGKPVIELDRVQFARARQQMAGQGTTARANLNSAR